MNERAEASPQVYARTAGLLYLLIFITAAASMALQSKLVVSGDAAATAGRITASLLTWRISVAAELVMFACDIPLAVLFYVLLRPIDANLALLAAFFRFAEAVTGGAIVTMHVAPILLLNGSGNFKALDSQALQELALLSIRLYDYGFGIALIPFGLHCAILGYLIYKSTYFPKTLGVLLTIAGVCYVINSFALIVAPSAANFTFVAILVSGFPAELGLCIWLIVCGVNIPKWDAVALRAGASKRPE